MTDLRTSLAALTDDQPQQPGDRLAGVTGRARRIRRTRAAVSVAAVLAVAAPVGLLVLPDRGTGTASYAGAPVTSWPDRSRPEKQGVAGGAVALFEQNNPGSSPVRWLFRGQLGTTDQYLVAFVADKAGTPTVVVGRTQLSEVNGSGLGGQETQGSYPWALYDAPVSTITDQVAMFVNTSAGSTPSKLYAGQQVADYRTTLFVLGAPDARRLDWSTSPLPFAPDSATTSGTLVSTNGVFLSSELRLNGLPTARLTDGRGRTSATTTLGLGTDQPNLVLPEPPVAQELERDLIGGSGPTDRSGDGTWHGPNYGLSRDELKKPTSTFVRCYGGGRLMLTVAENNPRPGQVSITGATPCDGQSHQVLTNLVLPSGDGYLSFGSDRLQVFTFVTRKG